MRRIKKIFIRELSDNELSYLDELGKYDNILSTTMLISQNQGGIDTTGRGVRASKVFTRQTLTGMSLRNILPYPSKYKHQAEESWDIGSIALLSRNIMEGYVSLYYYGIENVTEEDAELRFFLLQYHRNREWYQIRQKSGKNDSDLDEFTNVLEEQKKRIRDHPYISSLTKIQKDKVLQGYEIYKTKADLEKENKICLGLKLDYQLLSNLAHPLPLSIERMDNKKGRGIGNEIDINYCILALNIAQKYLAASTLGFTDFFYDQLGKKFKNALDEIRPFIS
ncbi:MAG: hypothetical protein WC209_01760 [Ignavibacteriaceae bacterium]